MQESDPARHDAWMRCLAASAAARSGCPSRSRFLTCLCTAAAAASSRLSHYSVMLGTTASVGRIILITRVSSDHDASALEPLPTQTRARARARVCACACACVVCVCVCARACVRAHVRSCVRACVCAQARTSVCLSVCLSVYVCCECVYIFLGLFSQPRQ